MRKELQDELFKKYPDVLDTDVEITAGDGWYWIMDQLCGCLRKYEDDTHLRDGIIAMADYITHNICDKCGQFHPPNPDCAIGYELPAVPNIDQPRNLAKSVTVE